jgi:ABC-type lipoprotein release transport system permease subunit
VSESGRVSPHRTLFWAAMELTWRHPLRLAVTVGCLVAVATPFLVGLAILEGVRAEAGASVQEGPDLLVTGYENGRNASLPDSILAHAKRIYRISRSRGRVIGRAYLEKSLVSVVGLESLRDVAVPEKGEAWIGASLAQDRHLTVGSSFAVTDVEELTVKIGKIFPAEAGIASARLVMLSLKDAQVLFGTSGRITDLQVWIQTEERERSQILLRVAYELRKSGIPLLIQTRKLVSDYVDRGFTLKGGTFLALYTVALAVLIPALLVTSGFGMSTRKREIGVMKALGFSVLDILEMAAYEVGVLATLSGCLSFLMAWGWIRLGNGFLIASFFIAELEHGHLLEIPAIFLPGPLLVTMGICVVLLGIGVVYTAYRVAISTPLEALR